MDIDLLKSSPEDQIDMLMMTQMDHIDNYNDVVAEMQPMEFRTSKLGHHHLPQSSTTFVNVSSTTQSFTGSPPVQELAELPFLANSHMGRWRNDNNGDGPTTANHHHEFPTQLEQKRNSMAAMREMIFRIAAMQPIHIDPESVKPPKRRNVKISTDPLSVAARHRRQRISERIRILQRLVPGGTKMETASMLDEAIHYVKFLKNQVQSLERAGVNRPVTTTGIRFPVPMCSESILALQQGTTKGGYHQSSALSHVQPYVDG